MKNLILIIACFLVITSCSPKIQSQNIITSDIDHFWEAYDKITTTTDSTEQYKILNEVFLEKGTPGLSAIMQVRRYTPESYIDAINNYPLFWQSIRENMGKANTFSKELELGVYKLKKCYPALKPAKVYFTVGAFRTSGTTLDSMVLIGSELAMADDKTITTEFPKNYEHLISYFSLNPIKAIVFLNVHEYVHTQQATAIGSNVLTQCLREGVAEFVAVKAMGEVSPTPAINFGKANAEKVKKKFAEDLFSYSYRDWLWNNTDNEFKTRDLGYYTGYAIAEKFYNEAKDKNQAIKQLIELDYGDDEAVALFVDKTGYFSSSIDSLREAAEKRRPAVTSISQFKTGDQNVDPKLTEITINFSRAMNQYSGGFDYGPLGEKNVLRVRNYVGWSEDGKAVTVEVALVPDQRYQLLVSERFLCTEGLPLKPFLVDIKTGTE